MPRRGFKFSRRPLVQVGPTGWDARPDKSIIYFSKGKRKDESVMLAFGKDREGRNRIVTKSRTNMGGWSLPSFTKIIRRTK